MESTLAMDVGLVYCTAVWGLTFYMVKGALDAVNPAVLVAYRFLLAALLLAPWAARRRNFMHLMKEGAILACYLSIVFLTQTLGLRYTLASNSAFITSLFVIFVPMYLWLIRHRAPERVQWLALAIALAGLWILTGGVGRVNQGDLLTLLTAAAVAAHLLATDAYAKGIGADTLLLAFHQFWMTGVISLAAALAWGAPLSVNSRSACGVIGFLAVFPTFSAYLIQTKVQRHAPPVKVAMIFTLEPVFAAIAAWTLGGESFRMTGALGGGLIVVAMIVSELYKLPLERARRNEILPV